MNVMRILYNTNTAIKRCNKRVMFAEPSKVIHSAKDTNKVKSLNWLTSNRKNFLLTKESIFLGKVSVAREKVKEISCYSFKTIYFIDYVVLKILLDDEKYIYTGMNRNDKLLKQLGVTYSKPDSSRNFASYFFLVALILFILSRLI